MLLHAAAPSICRSTYYKTCHVSQLISYSYLFHKDRKEYAASSVPQIKLYSPRCGRAQLSLGCFRVCQPSEPTRAKLGSMHNAVVAKQAYKPNQVSATKLQDRSVEWLYLPGQLEERQEAGGQARMAMVKSPSDALIAVAPSSHKRSAQQHKSRARG